MSAFAEDEGGVDREVETVVSDRKVVASKFYEGAGFTRDQIPDHMEGIDMTRPLEVVEVPEGKILQQWQVEGNWQGNYYSEIGLSPDELGINPKGTSFVDGEISLKKAKHYKLTKSMKMLKSIAKKINDNRSVAGEDYLASGGGVQYFGVQKEFMEEVSNETE